MLRAINLNPRDVMAVNAAIELLRRFDHPEFVAVMTKLVAVEHDPYFCGCSADACVSAARPRVMVLRDPPSVLGQLDLAVLLRHEAHHIQLLPGGRYWMLPHQCSEPHCLDPYERFADPVYSADELTRTRIVNGLEIEQQAREWEYLASRNMLPWPYSEAHRSRAFLPGMNPLASGFRGM